MLFEKNDRYYKEIAKAVRRETGKSIHKDTIRNIYEQKVNPRLYTLDVLSKYVLDDETATFQSFKLQFGTLETAQIPLHDIIDNKTPRKGIKPMLLKTLLIASLSIAVALISMALFDSKSRDHEEYSQHFDDFTIESLENEGWKIFINTNDGKPTAKAART